MRRSTEELGKNDCRRRRGATERGTRNKQGSKDRLEQQQVEVARRLEESVTTAKARPLDGADEVSKAANGGRAETVRRSRAIPAQPSAVISGMAALALVDPVTASKYRVAVFCLRLPWGPQRAPICAAPDPITFRIYKFSLEGLGKASSAQEARRAAASIAGCISLTAKCGRLTAGPCFFIATRPSAPGTKAHQPGPVQKLSYNFNIKTKTSIVASLLLVLRHLETFSVLFPRHSPAIARRAFHLFWLLASKLCPRAVTFNEALASD